MKVQKEVQPVVLKEVAIEETTEEVVVIVEDVVVETVVDVAAIAEEGDKFN